MLVSASDEAPNEAPIVDEGNSDVALFWDKSVIPFEINDTCRNWLIPLLSRNDLPKTGSLGKHYTVISPYNQ